MVIKQNDKTIVNEVGTSEDVLFVVGKAPKVQAEELAIAA